MAIVGQPLTEPESGWKRYEATASIVKGKGNLIINSNVGYSNGNALYLMQKGESFLFDFIGDKVRITDVLAPTRTDKIVVKIDGVLVGEFSEYTTDANQFKTLVFEKKGLNYSRHTVELISDKQNSSNYNMSLDLIDIDSSGRILHPDEVTDPKDLEVGKRIRCHYQAASGQVGVFSGLGQETSDFIPVTSTATPNGDFYFIMVEDWNKKKILLADRNIQHSISWDSLNSAGIASGSGIQLPYVVFATDGNPITVVTDLGLTVMDNDDSSVALYKVIRATNGVKSGKWYYEAYCISTSTQTSGRGFRFMTGLIDKLSNISTGNGTNSAEFVASVNKVLAIDFEGNILPYNITTDVTINSGDTIGVAFDLDNGYISFYKNGALLATKEIEKGVEWYPFHSSKWLSKVTYNFGETKFKYALPQGFEPFITSKNQRDIKTIRLMTGGVSSSYKDNECDKYIVNSTLNETITAGDNNVWNWNLIWSWSSTTRTISEQTSSHRVLRGGPNFAIGTWGSGVSSTINGANNYIFGFRPVLEIELPPQYKSFIKIKNEYKTYKSSWKTISATLPTLDTFKKEGMDNLSVLDRKTKSFVLPMDDNTASGEVLGNGKVFKEKIDLKKYFEIVSIGTK
ncbi:hypothetical protein EHV15_28435 [Paenibacillus oralis]|uniref:B30.2/SPRY domain-containing protein n=1 Tax=Paenibacillus oralis TaxID=2490856 RepID=A0A3P3U7S9_9BACL|nr:SPRY domain-containing protein [Paenibacillus oralis]RRJ66412.1 hypothetical protein EHV15_28435 [Paenibacillus oralis]